MYAVKKVNGDFEFEDGTASWAAQPFFGLVDTAGRVHRGAKSGQYAWTKKTSAAAWAAVLDNPTDATWDAFYATKPTLWNISGLAADLSL